MAALEGTPLPGRSRCIYARSGCWPGQAWTGGQRVPGDPVGYLDMLALHKRTAIIVTGSGGVQEAVGMVGTSRVIWAPVSMGRSR